MINYNPKEWFTFIFRIHKADTFRKLAPLLLAVAIYSGCIVYLEINILHLDDDSKIRNINLVHTILSFVISTLLVFRTNTAYDRWWEARRQLGSLVNTSRNLAIKLSALVKDPAGREFFSHSIALFAATLKDHLRNEKHKDPEAPFPLNYSHHLPNQVASAITAKVYQMQQEGKLSAEQLIILNPDITALTDICGACERIRNTPIPFSYSVFIKKFIFFFVMTLPFGWSFTLGYLVIPLVAFVLYVLASLELIAEEIEDPFGYDANDLPVDQICANIRKHVGELLA